MTEAMRVGGFFVVPSRTYTTGAYRMLERLGHDPAAFPIPADGQPVYSVETITSMLCEWAEMGLRCGDCQKGGEQCPIEPEHIFGRG
jgi:hypothetical protein